MALRLIEMVLAEKDGVEVRELLKEHKLLEHRQVRLQDGQVLVRILLDAEQSEAVLDALEERSTGDCDRVVILPVEATLPRAEPEPADAAEPAGAKDRAPERIGREELYEDIKKAAPCSRVYLAMVIAPLLGSNMALSLGTTLGDVSLLRRALLTAMAGIALTMVLSVIIGVPLHLNPAAPEVASRNGVGLGDVAVALLPPLVTSGLLLGGGHWASAMGALPLFLMNLICVNLAAVTTFLIQGIRPATWWEKDRATKATRIALGLWVALLAALGGMVFLLRRN
jgi:Domain of unknown function (DUF389)